MLSKVKQARGRIEALRAALVDSWPEEIGAALQGLEEAVATLSAVEQALRGGQPAPIQLRRELKQLRDDLRLNGKLIAQGVAFCQGWAKLLGAGPGYTPAGYAAPSRPSASLSLQG
jgi:hypothetical protein